MKIPGEMGLGEYVRETLMMGESDEVCAPHSAIAKHVQLQHLVSLWSLLDEVKMMFLLMIIGNNVYLF